MTSPLRVLIVEDSQADYLVTLRVLREDGRVLEARRVDRLGDLRTALRETWDAVISDYSVPGLAFRETLAAVQQSAADLPVLLFTGTIGEEEAVALLKLGVRDYVRKDRPGRLPSALRSALAEAGNLRAQSSAAAALAASEARFRATFENAAVGISQLALDGRILIANERNCAILGYPSGELLKLNWLDLGPAEQKAAAQQQIRRLGAGDFSSFTEETLDTRKDGSTVWVSQSVSLVRDGQGRPDFLIAVLEDLTDRRRARAREHQMERELDHLQRLESVGRMAGGVSHDMNNVLAAIMAMASVLEARHQECPEMARSAGAILDAAIRGRDLVKGLTEFARKDQREAGPLDLNVLVRREAELLEHTTFKKVAIRLDLEEPLPEVLGEASALANALMNLCVNACDAMPGGGTLRLSTRLLAGGLVEMAVEDDGEGMPPEVAARAMEPFFTTKPIGKGTGLGLALVQATVKGHGGTVSLRSTLGAGTRVALVLPRLAAEARAVPVAAAPCWAPGRGLRLLLVDDDELIRQTVPMLLEHLGHQVRVAGGGLEGLSLLAAGLEVDLAIVDVNMPGLDGVETLGRLRSLRPDLPVLLATGFVDERMPGVLNRFPNVRVLAKPFTLADLAAGLADWTR